MKLNDMKASSDGKSTTFTFDITLSPRDRKKLEQFIAEGRLPELEAALREQFSAKTTVKIEPVDFRGTERKKRSRGQDDSSPPGRF